MKGVNFSWAPLMVHSRMLACLAVRRSRLQEVKNEVTAVLQLLLQCLEFCCFDLLSLLTIWASRHNLGRTLAAQP
jgi:hypothetical protein